MSFRQDAAGFVCQGHGKRAAVFESEDKRCPNQIGDVLVRWEIDRALDSMKSRDRQSIPGQSLVSRDLVSHLLQQLTVVAEISNARAFLNQLHVRL